MDYVVSLLGLIAGVFIGLTGMGGGALLTPLLVLGFNVPIGVAVSSDVVASLVIKPVGALVHAKRGTVERGLVWLLAMGSVPGALVGSLLFHYLALDTGVGYLKTLLGCALLVAAGAIWLKSRVSSRMPNLSLTATARRPLVVTIGVLGGVMVGLTSVGSGSLMLALLMLVYPTLSASRLVGTDLAQAVPLVAAAALGHVFFGKVDYALTGSLLLGAVPGVIAGARLSSVAPDRWIRPVLLVALIAAALKLLNAGTAAFIVSLVAFALAGAAALSRPRQPEPALESGTGKMTR